MHIVGFLIRMLIGQPMYAKMPLFVKVGETLVLFHEPNYFLAYSRNKRENQRSSCSNISFFTAVSEHRIFFIYLYFRALTSFNWVQKQINLSLNWVESPKIGFVLAMLIYDI